MLWQDGLNQNRKGENPQLEDSYDGETPLASSFSTDREPIRVLVPLMMVGGNSRKLTATFDTYKLTMRYLQFVIKIQAFLEIQ